MPYFLAKTVDIFLSYWWIYSPIVLFLLFRALWLVYIQTLTAKAINWVLLEVKIPKEILKTPKAMEQFFAGLSGVKSGANFVEKWWEGKIQQWMSCEIVGKNGDIYFFIRTPVGFRNLVEANIYSQYPDAEIKEAPDYVFDVPEDVPNKDYNLWGTEFVLVKEDAYPIRTYIAFEEQVEEKRLDPLANLAEVLSKLKDGEQIWLQYLVKPADDEWKKKGDALVAKLIGKKIPSKEGPLWKALVWVGQFFRDLIIGLYKIPEQLSADEKKEAMASLMQYLSPGEKEVVAAIEMNLSKIGMDTAIRFIYIGRSDIFSRGNISAIIGTFKLFNTLNLNGFRPNKLASTSVDYFFKKRREYAQKRRLLNAYKLRMFTSKPFVLNIEEWATIYHYPTYIIEAPTVRRIEAKKGEPPIGLPT